MSEHGLWFEGAPHDDKGHRIVSDGRYVGVGGVGRAACRCGALSPVLPSAYQRKKWHREHKAEVATSSDPVTPDPAQVDVAELRMAFDPASALVDDATAASVIAALDRLEAAEAKVAAVRALYDETDTEGYEHNGHAMFEGEPECPGCWRKSIRIAIDAPPGVERASIGGDRRLVGPRDALTGRFKTSKGALERTP